MSKKKKKSKDDEQGVGQPTNGIPELPEGFETVGPVDGIQTWFRPSIGDIVHGRLLGRHERGTGRKQAFYQVRLYAPASGIQGKGDEAELVELAKGDIINVNETKVLQDLRPLTGGDGIYDVHITVLEKVELDSGNTFWRMRIATKTLRKPTFVPAVSKDEPAPASDSINDDHIPF